jgi:Mitochondrial carrier protein
MSSLGVQNSSIEHHELISLIASMQVKLQASQGQATSALVVARHTLRHEGVLGLYRGMGLPLAITAAYNAVMFSTRGATDKLLESYHGAVLMFAASLCLRMKCTTSSQQSDTVTMPC